MSGAGPFQSTAAGSDTPTVADTQSSPADRELVERAAAGDRAAFGALYERYRGTVHGVLVATGPLEEARDLVHDVFLRALASLPRLDHPERVGPWLCTIARNRARDAFKKSGRVTESAEVLETLADKPPDDDNAEEASAVLDAVRELPEAYRETLALRLVEGLTGPEIADRTGLTHGSVRVNLHRGMKLLKERLSRLGWEVPE